MTDPVTRPPADVQNLAAAVREMSTTMTHLAGTVTDQNKRLDTQNDALVALGDDQLQQRWMTRLLMGLYAVDILLIIGSIITFTVIITNAAADRAELRETVSRQDVTRDVVLCPLFRILTALESPAARERYPFGPDAYDKDISELRLGYMTLRCG